MPSFLNPYALYVKLGLGLVLALFAAWAFRVNQLRAEYHDDLDQVALHLKSSGAKELRFGELGISIDWLATSRDTYKQDWTNATHELDVQNTHVKDLQAQTQLAAQLGAQAQAQVQDAVAQRNAWIAQAAAGANRSVPLPLSQELDQCTSSLTNLYRQGF